MIKNLLGILSVACLPAVAMAWPKGVEPVYFVHYEGKPQDAELQLKLQNLGIAQDAELMPELDLVVLKDSPAVRKLAERVRAYGTMRALGTSPLGDGVRVTSIEANRLIRPAARFTPIPTDPDWLARQRAYERLNLTGAWAMIFPFFPLREVTVAVIDSGVDTVHPDLTDRLWTNVNEIPDNGKDDDKNGLVDDIHGWNYESPAAGLRDDNGHGTHVAGIIAAAHGNGLGIAGVAPNARIMGLRFMDKSGNGSTLRAIQAMKYAAQNGAEVINASWGSDGNSSAMAKAIQTAADAGVLFIAAAGNDGRDADRRPMSPASEPGANHLSVASSDGEGSLSGFSNFGRTSVDLAAPGSDIYSTIPEGRWGTKSGTSMATPMVAGVAAMVRGLLPFSPGRARSLAATHQLRNLLLAAVNVRSSYTERVATSGDLSAARAVMLAMRVSPQPNDQLWPRALTLAVGDTLPLTYGGSSVNVAWGVSDSTFGQISPTGVLTTLAEGSVYVTTLDAQGVKLEAGPFRVVAKPTPVSGGGCRGRSNGLELAFVGALVARFGLLRRRRK